MGMKTNNFERDLDQINIGLPMKKQHSQYYSTKQNVYNYQK